MEQKLNKLLANLIVEYHKLQGYHWYVKGHDFMVIHTKLEEYYSSFLEFTDKVAEGMLINGLKPLTTLSNHLIESSLKEFEEHFISSAEVINSLIFDFVLINDQVKEIKKLSDDQSIYYLSLLMDELMTFLGKSLWMLRQSKE